MGVTERTMQVIFQLINLRISKAMNFT